MVEERRTRFEGVGHRRDVDLRDEVPGKIGGAVDLEHDVADVEPRGGLPGSDDRSERVAPGERRGELIRVERVPLLPVEDLHVPRVALGRVERQVPEQAASALHRARDRPAGWKAAAEGGQGAANAKRDPVDPAGE